MYTLDDDFCFLARLSEFVCPTVIEKNRQNLWKKDLWKLFSGRLSRKRQESLEKIDWPFGFVWICLSWLQSFLFVVFARLVLLCKSRRTVFRLLKKLDSYDVAGEGFIVVLFARKSSRLNFIYFANFFHFINFFYNFFKFFSRKIRLNFKF